jgi:hypothetical protein
MIKSLLTTFYLLLIISSKAGSGFVGDCAGLVSIKPDFNTQGLNLSMGTCASSNSFNGYNFGITSTSLKINQVLLRTSETSPHTVTAAYLYYKVYKTSLGSSSSIFKTINLTAVTNNFNGVTGQKEWSRPIGFADEDLINAMVESSTMYTIEMYFSADVNGTSGVTTMLLQNGGGNFSTQFKSANILSINSLQGFATRVQGSQVLVNWVMAIETNLESLELEKSENGVNWIRAAAYNSLAPSGSTNFSYLDTDPYATLTLYRLKSKTTTGIISYSRVVRAALGFVENSLQIYPNPCVGKINVLLNGIKKGDYSAFLYDVTGRRIFLENFYHDGFNQQREIIFPATVQKGHYLLLLQSKNEFYKQQVVKE